MAVDPTAPPGDWGLPANWRPSSEPGGSPGMAEPVPSPATLAIALSAALDGLSLAWAADSGAYKVYSATAFAPPAQWIAVTNAPVLSDGRWVVTLPLAKTTCFYRLQKQ